MVAAGNNAGRETHSPRQRARGFTLVELAIVLVIIGLLIGGILAAQSMIATAGLQKAVRQLEQYQIAITNFQTRYNQLPGDSNLFPDGNGIRGNNDGMIVSYDYCCDADGNSTFDAGNVWMHLSSGVGLKNDQGGAYETFGAYTFADGKNIPMLKFSSQNAGFVRWGQSYYPSLTLVYDEWIIPRRHIFRYALEEWVSSYGNIPVANALRAADVLSLDKKLDDGLPNSGRFRSAYGLISGPTDDFGADPCSVGNSYRLEGSSFRCNFVLDLGQ